MSGWGSMDNIGVLLGVAGGVFGSVIGIMGALVGVLAPRGKGKRTLMGITWVFAAIGVSCLLVGAGAGLTGQPYGLWYPLTLIGIIATPLCVGGLFLLPRVYRQAEARKLEAAMIRRGV